MMESEFGEVSVDDERLVLMDVYRYICHRFHVCC